MARVQRPVDYLSQYPCLHCLELATVQQYKRLCTQACVGARRYAEHLHYLPQYLLLYLEYSGLWVPCHSTLLQYLEYIGPWVHCHSTLHLGILPQYFDFTNLSIAIIGLCDISTLARWNFATVP